MYQSSYPTSASRIAANMPLHKSSKAVRKFVIRSTLMFIVILLAVSIGAFVQANAGTNEKRTNVPITVDHVTAAAPTVFVEQGDTLWNIAQAHAPSGTNVRIYIEQIKRLNHMTGSTLHIGQKLQLP